MCRKSALSTKTMVLTALLAALTVVGSSLRITLPLDIGGENASFHLGNILCALSGILLGPGFGALAAGLGSALYDMLNPLYISEAWITFLMKGAYGLCTGLVIRGMRSRWGYPRAIAATAAGALVYAGIYLAKSYWYSGIFLKALTPEAATLSLIGKLPATAFNAAVAVVFAPVLAVSIRRALEKSNLHCL